MAPRPTKKSPGSTTPQPPPRPDLPVQARHPPPPGLPATAPRPTAVVDRVAELMGGKGLARDGGDDQRDLEVVERPRRQAQRARLDGAGGDRRPGPVPVGVPAADLLGHGLPVA